MLPCPRCKDMVDPEEYRFCPNCGTPIVLPQEPVVQPAVQVRSGAEFSAPQPQIQASEPQVWTPETPQAQQAQQISPSLTEQSVPPAPLQQTEPAAPVQSAPVNQPVIPQQEPRYQQPAPQIPMNQQPAQPPFNPAYAPQPMPQQPYCTSQAQPPVYMGPPQYSPQSQPGHPQNPPVGYQPVYYYPPAQPKQRGNGAAITGLAFGAVSLYMMLMELMALLLNSSASFTIPILLAIPGEVLGIVSICRKTPKKILGILALSFSAAVHIVCITADIFGRL